MVTLNFVSMQIKDILLKQAKVVENPSSDFLTKVMRDKQITRKGEVIYYWSKCLWTDIAEQIFNSSFVVSVNIPQQPDWLFKRPYLTLDFMTIGDSTTNEVRYIYCLIKNLLLKQKLLCIHRIIKTKYLKH